jgi:hypothetical protein
VLLRKQEPRAASYLTTLGSLHSQEHD